LARELVRTAIERYDEARSTLREIQEEARPFLRSEAGRDGRDEWRTLCKAAREEFNSAEMGLADRIDRLYEVLATEDRGDGDFGAVRHRDRIYALAYDATQWEAGTNIIATYREPMVINLDAAGPA
jgi:hypothetical protein